MSSQQLDIDLRTLYQELRRLLAAGKLSEAEAANSRLEALLALREPDAGAERSLQQIHAETVKWLVGGIRYTIAGDYRTGLEQLTRIPHLDEAAPGAVSLRWLVTIWRTKALCGAGEIQKAREEAERGLALAETLDLRDRSVSLTMLGEIEHLAGAHEEALEHLESAEELHRQVQNYRGVASARLTQARVMSAAGRTADCGVKAFSAALVDPSWSEPIVFLARQAMKAGQLKRAERTLRFIDKLGARRADRLREMRLLSAIQKQQIPAGVVQEYLDLEETPPAPAVVERMQALVDKNPDFVQLREGLAWKLLRLGRHEQAGAQFERLRHCKLDEQMRSSVMLGLGTLAIALQSDKLPGKRLSAAVSVSGPGSAATPTGRRRRDRAQRRGARRGPPPLPEEGVDLAQTIPAGLLDELPSLASSDTAFALERNILEGDQAVFTGGLDHLTGPELLQFFHAGRQTGTLVLSAEEGLGAVYLRNGQIVGAATTNCRSIGELLVGEGRITRQQLHQAMQSQSKEGQDRLLGAILVDKGWVELSAMREALTNQVYTAIDEVMSWTEGRFAFSPDPRLREVPGEVEIALDPQMVLLELARRMDEANRDAELAEQALSDDEDSF